MTAIIPAHRGRSVDVDVLSAQLHAAKYVAMMLRDSDLDARTAHDLRRWMLGGLYELGAQVGRFRHAPTAAEPFTEEELNNPHLLEGLAAHRRAAVDAFDAQMIDGGADTADLPALREHYLPDAHIVGAFLDRLIATVCALEERCRTAAAPQPAPERLGGRELAALAAEIFADLVLAVLHTLNKAGRDRPAARIDPTGTQAVTLTRAARAPGAATSV